MNALINRNNLDLSLIPGATPGQPSDILAGHILEAGKRFAHTLLTGAKREFGAHLIVGEVPAITAFAGALVARDNLLLVSIPGAGKTETLAHGYRIIGGFHRDNIVSVPARPDLTPAELTGKAQNMETTREIKGEAPITERTSGVFEPMLHTGIQIAAFDEVNRGNPRTLGAALDVTGSRRIDTPTGSKDMDALEVAILAMNPTESLLTTSRLSPAMAARQAWGAVLADDSEWVAILHGIVMDEFEPTPEGIQPVINLAQLHVAQAAVRYVAIENTQLKPRLELSTVHMLHTLRERDDHMIQEAPGRVAKQLMRTARTLALMNNRVDVKEEDINDAVESKLTATLAGHGISDLREIDDVVEEVVQKSERSMVAGQSLEELVTSKIRKRN